MTRVKAVSVLMATLMMFSVPKIYAQSADFNAGKNLNLQYAILRALETQYVDSVRMDELIQTGIDAMLRSLDPYTVLIPEENEDDLDMLTTGSYGGVGAVIRKHDSGGIMIVEPYIGSPAVKVGLVPGDIILEIDEINTNDIDVSKASDNMRGQPGTELKMKIQKIRSGDTVDVSLIRERVHIPDVVYYGMLQDSIGYIQIGGFTLDGSRDVRRAVEELKVGGKMKRLVLDLRSNGGGLMPEAIDILSLFLPNGTMVVSSEGKSPYSNTEYFVENEPIDTITPIMVMVNSVSASSSEIVAGAMQDLDRAVIAGNRTFGKGLIQSIRDVGYNSSLKLTTGKYYTPSGRCVQALDYSLSGEASEVPDSLKKEFKTVGGRSVYDGGGIAPDIEIESRSYNRPLVALVYSNLLSDFAIEYYRNHEEIAPPSDFSLTDNEYEDFVAFASSQEFDSRTEAQIEMEKVISAAKRDGVFSEDVSKELELVKGKLTLDKKGFLERNRETIRPFLEQEIVLKYYYRKGRAESALRTDSQLYEAIKKWDTVEL